jgi:hypothetical protein
MTRPPKQPAEVRHASGGRAADQPSRGTGPLDPATRGEIVAFLRDWLPPTAIATYRDMILANPESWHRSPHFASGFVVDHFLRGNGITERELGVETLEPYWAEILRDAVLGERS